MGITYLCAAFSLHHWLFRDGFSAGFGSRKLELVDRLGDPDSIFEKIRFLLYNLPEWFLPSGYDRREHDNQARLINPANGSTITGEGGDNIGRGGRKTIYFVDEAAFLERPQSVDRALSQTTRVRIDLSTPNGPGNPFATRRHSGKVPVFTFHWRDDPRKDQNWYDKEVIRLGDPVTVAQELDIDFSASIEGIAIPGVWVRSAVELDLPPSGPSVAGLDIAEEGPALCVFTSRRGPLVDNPRSWGGLDTIQTAHRGADAAEELGVTLVAYDADGIGATVRGAWKRTERPLRFHVRPVHGGGPGTEARWPDGRLGRERFRNLRAELYWMVRTRFEKTHAYVTRGERHPPEDLISIPNHPQLIADLSLPRYFFTDVGKIQIESKQEMKRRGVKSPDFADSLCYSFAPGKPGLGAGAFAGAGEPNPYEPPRPRRARASDFAGASGYGGGGLPW